MEIIKEIRITGEQFVETMQRLDQKEFNDTPFEGSWNAGQVGDHVIKFAGGGLLCLNGEMSTAERDPALHVGWLRDVFLNNDIQMKAPPMVQPGSGPFNKAIQLESLQQIFAGLEKAAADKPLDHLTIFDMPTKGRLTGLEILHFVAVHVQRHTRQLKNIIACLQQDRIG